MRRRLAAPVLAALAVLAAGSALSTAGCKQGDGDRCQIQADCESGLVCNAARGVCTGSNNNGAFDASVAVDAPHDAAVDARPIDARPIDAPADASKPLDAFVKLDAL